MKYTQLGRSGLTVSRLVLGTLNFGPETSEPDSHALMDRAHEHGINFIGGDAPVTEIAADTFARLMAINLEGMVLACKHTLPAMRRQGYGVITNISSNAAIIDYPYVAYKTSKAGVIALTQHLAIRNAEYGIRVNMVAAAPGSTQRHPASGPSWHPLHARTP